MKAMRQSIEAAFRQDGVINAIAILNLLNAALAFFKDAALAAYLGTSSEADAFSQAMFIPDTIGVNLLAAALGTACIPMFAKLQSNGNRLRNAAVTVAWRTLLVSAALIAALLLLGEQAVYAVAPGLDGPSAELCAALLRILLPIVALSPLLVIAGALLQAKLSFWQTAFAPLLTQVIVLACAIGLIVFGYPRRDGAVWLAAACLAGVCASAAFLFWSLYRRYRTNRCEPSGGMKFSDSALPSDKRDIRRIFRTFVPYFLIVACMQIVLFAERFIASRMETGTLAALNYAYRVSQFPNWVFVAAVAMVVLPSLAIDWEAGRVDAVHKRMRRALALTVAVTVPFATVLSFASGPVVTILFRRGSFDEHSQAMTSAILAAYAFAIVGQSVSAVLLRYFLAAGRMWLPAVCYAFATAVNVGLAFALTGPFGAAGFGYAAALSAALCAVALRICLKRTASVPMTASVSIDRSA